MSKGVVCRTAPATPCLLIIVLLAVNLLLGKYLLCNLMKPYPQGPGLAEIASALAQGPSLQKGAPLQPVNLETRVKAAGPSIRFGGPPLQVTWKQIQNFLQNKFIGWI